MKASRTKDGQCKAFNRQIRTVKLTLGLGHNALSWLTNAGLSNVVDPGGNHAVVLGAPNSLASAVAADERAH